MSENFPKSLMENVLWSFGGEIFDSQAEFSETIRRRQIDVKGKDDWQPEKIVLQSAVVEVIYEFWKDDDQVSEKIRISADNGEFFTAGELLFKIHNAVTENLRGMDRRFFEGLTLNKPPSYWLGLGS